MLRNWHSCIAAKSVNKRRTKHYLAGNGPANRKTVTRLFLAVATIAVLAPSPAAAKIDYEIERPIITLTLEYQEKEENRLGPGIDPRSEETDTFWQRLELRSRGWLYHPDLFLFSFGIEPQWKQQDTTASDSFSRGDDDTFLGYFLDAQVLRQKTHSFKLFLRQSRNEFNSTLSPDNVTETDIVRTSWLFDNQLFPTSLTLEKNDTKFEDFFSTRDESDILRLESKYTSDKHQVRLLTEYVDQLRQIGLQEFNVDRFLTNINSTYFFTDSTRLMSSIFALDSESEVSDSSSFLWSERLMLEHRPNLRTEYNARFDFRENDSFKSDARFFSGAIEHQLYDNLTSRLELYTSDDRFDDGEIDIRGADLDFRYLRKIPVGMLTITNGYAYRLEDNNIDAESSQVLGESHSLTATTPELLARARIELDSVTVTDASRTITYVEGIDYALAVIGDSVTIERLLFGGITDGEVVLVDYVYATQAPFETDRKSARFGASLNLWRVLRLHYNYSRIKEDLVSGTRPFDLSNDRIQRVGASLHWRWSTTTAEFEDRDTVRTPLKRRRLQQSFRFSANRSMSIGVSASYAETDFRDSGSDTQSVGFGGNLRWNLGRWGRLEVNAFSREIDGDSQRTNSDGVIAKWSLRYGDWSGFVRYENLDETDDLTIQARDRKLVTFHVARVFR